MSDDFVLVPFYVESDGSKTFFLPELKRSKGYQIGAKGREEYWQDYWAALSRLIEMDSPKFRRKNKNNIAGIVSCNVGDVEEVSRKFIEEEFAKYAG